MLQEAQPEKGLKAWKANGSQLPGGVRQSKANYDPQRNTLADVIPAENRWHTQRAQSGSFEKRVIKGLFTKMPAKFGKNCK